VFTVHGPPSVPLQKALADDQKIERISIKTSYRRELLLELDHYGMNKLSLFPDLDGLSEYINWFMKNRAQGKDSDQLGEDLSWDLEEG
jgi:hypothetical protein